MLAQHLREGWIEIIHDHSRLALVAIKPLIAQLWVELGIVSSSLTTLPDTGRAVDPNPSSGLRVLESKAVLFDLAEVSVVLNYNVGRDTLELSFFGLGVDLFPVYLRTAPYRLCPYL